MGVTTIDETTSASLHVRDLGQRAYAEAFALQRQLQQAVIDARSEQPKPGHSHARDLGHLLLVEHDPPVITVSRRKTARQHLVATPEMLEREGVEVAETDRGGDITYHGPGQLVVYPILDLNLLGLRLHGYMRLLEQVVIDVLSQYGIVGERDERATGVWVAPRAATHPSRQEAHHAAKICAMGVRISRWVTMHGLALNVTTNLDHFGLIVPCGLADRSVTNMKELLGKLCPSMDEVKRTMVAAFEARTGDLLRGQR